MCFREPEVEICNKYGMWASSKGQTVSLGKPGRCRQMQQGCMWPEGFTQGKGCKHDFKQGPEGQAEVEKERKS